jgi:hypothetical protein
MNIILPARTQWVNTLMGTKPQFRYYQGAQCLLVIDQEVSFRSALGMNIHGAGHSAEGDILVNAAEIEAAGFVEITEQEAYQLADRLPQEIPKEKGTHGNYQAFLLCRALVRRASAELEARCQEAGELRISEIDSYDRDITRRWTVQSGRERFDLGLMRHHQPSELVVLVSAEGEVE